MGRLTRTGVAAFDAAAMVTAASIATEGRAADDPLGVALWGSAVAAIVVALVVAVRGSGAVAWVAIGYLLYAALLAATQATVFILALAVALVPIAPRPRGSLAYGILIATAAAFLTWAITGLPSAV